jgi:NitT/TauT family transport system substrate-binding protein
MSRARSLGRGRLFQGGLLAAALLVACAAPTSGPAVAPAASAPQAAPAAASEPGARPAQSLTRVVQAFPVEAFVYLPLYLGIEKGFFLEEGIELEAPVMAPSTAVAGLISGDVHFTVAGSGVRAAMQGAPLKAVLYYFNSILFELVTVPEIRSVADLKGKNLGTSARGSTEETTANALLTQAGLDPAQDVTYVLIPAGTQLPTLLSESIHGMMIALDQSSVAQRSGLRVLKTVEDVGQAMPHPFAGFVTATDLIQKRPDLVKAWIRANLRALKYWQDNPGAAAAIGAQRFGMDPAAAEEVSRKAARTINPNDIGGIWEEGFQFELASNLSALGGQAQVTRISDLLDLTLLRQAQRELGMPCRSGYQCN